MISVVVRPPQRVVAVAEDDSKICASVREVTLGIAVSETTVEMTTNHPVYCYRNGGIQKWTGAQAEIDALEARIEALESALNV